MKKLIFAVAISILATLPMAAQEKVQKPSKFGDNWYIQLQGGASYTFSEASRKASVGDLIAPSVAVALGKDFTPVFGLRLKGSGWEAKGQYMWQDATYKYNYIQGSLDAMVNLTNAFLPYDKDRVFNLKGFAGFGLTHVMHKNSVDPYGDGGRLEKANMVTPRIGLQADFLVHNNVSLNLEVAGNLLSDRFNGVRSGTNYDGMLTAMGGVTFHFNNRGFDVVDYVDPSIIEGLNAKLNEQRALVSQKDSKISDLERELAKKPTVVVEEKAVEVEVEEVLMNAVVVFKLGKSDLQDNQEINIFNAAKFFQDNPEYNCVITGYADKATGNPTINQKISERRAEAVAKILIEKFGISPTRVTTKASGDKEQPFQIDAWNRVATFTAVKVK